MIFMDASVPSCLLYRDCRQGGMNRAYTIKLSREYTEDMMNVKKLGPRQLLAGVRWFEASS